MTVDGLRLSRRGRLLTVTHNDQHITLTIDQWALIVADFLQPAIDEQQ